MNGFGHSFEEIHILLYTPLQFKASLKNTVCHLPDKIMQ